MGKIRVTLLILISLIALGVIMSYFKPIKKELTPKKIIPKFTLGKLGNGLGEFHTIGSLLVKDNYLYVTDLDNQRIQVLKINSDGNLTALYSFGKKGTGLGEFDGIGAIVIKGDYLYVVEATDDLDLAMKKKGNHRIQVFKINSDGNISPRFTFFKKGKRLGEFYSPRLLAIKENWLYVSDTGNNRIQVLEIKY